MRAHQPSHVVARKLTHPPRADITSESIQLELSLQRKRMKSVQFFFGALIVAAAVSGTLPQRQLRYALFTSGPGGAFDSSGAIPAIKLAEKEIMMDPSILPGYSLQHTAVQDTLVRTVEQLLRRNSVNVRGL